MIQRQCGAGTQTLAQNAYKNLTVEFGYFRAEQAEVRVRSGCNSERRRQDPEGKQGLGGDHGRDHHHGGGEAQDPGSAAAGR